MNMDDIYGLVPMTFEEEVNASDTVKAKRRAKINIVDWCNIIRQYANQIEDRAKRIPENEDEWHRELVEKFRDQVGSVLQTIELVALYDGWLRKGDDENDAV